MENKSKNREWKESGTDMSFKNWLRVDLDNNVQVTRAFLGADGSVSESKINPNDNYQPNLTNNTVLGVNKYLVYTVGSLVAIAIAVSVFK